MLKALTTASGTAEAPHNDLELLKSLKKFSSTCQAISSATISKFKNYAWYLSEDLIALALLDDNVPLLTKNNLVASNEDPKWIEKFS